MRSVRASALMSCSFTDVIHEPRELPVVLSAEEVTRLLRCGTGLKCKAALNRTKASGKAALGSQHALGRIISRKRTFAHFSLRSAKGHLQTHAPQQIELLAEHLVDGQSGGRRAR